MPRSAVFAIFVFAGAGFAQPAFEAASVKIFPEGAPVQFSGCMGGPGSDDPGRIDCRYASLQMLLARAYEVKTQEIFGPGWIETAHFDILAKLPHGATREQVPAMFRTLLAERFKVALHHETRPLPGYAITVAKSGLKIKETDNTAAPEDPPSDGKIHRDEEGFPILRPSVIRQGAVILYNNGRARLTGGNIPMRQLAESLSRQLDRIVVDETGLPGKYDMTLNWTPEPPEPGARPRDASSAPSVDLLTALETQLGLKLVSKKVDRDTLVVDRAEKVPVDN